MLDWPPAYTIKKHPRARSVKLKASVEHGLELVVPLRFSLKHVPSILQEHQAWIQKQLAKIASQREIRSAAQLPTQIIFPAANETWRIDYVPCKTRLKLMSRPQREIVLLGDITDKQACKQLLIAWLKRRAKLHLPQQLAALSAKLQMPFSKVTIRDQQTRLGSCSPDKSINLNYRLVLLPENLSAYVIIHELCHTVHLNHSDKFWQLVEKHDPNWRVHDAQTFKINKLMPEWLL